jgi:CubicO group peptidase (beta-lactamase class C family)
MSASPDGSGKSGLGRRMLIKAAAASPVLAAPGAAVAQAPTGVPGRYGWDGGYGTSWYVDPSEEMVGILMTQRLWDPTFLAVHHDFWTSAYQAIDD